MIDKMQLIEEIRAVFGQNEYPGDDYLLGSTEGSEPLEEIQPFIGRTDWTKIPSEVLDAHSGSLTFFSEAGYRFFLPAYLDADLNEQLLIADPVFTLMHGFSNLSVPHEIGGNSFVRKTGKDAFVNPRRYGALTFEDYSRYRLSVFTREEAGVIVKYLEYKQDSDLDGLGQDRINAALNSFWYERQKSAPTAQVISDHLQAEEEYLAAFFKMGE